MKDITGKRKGCSKQDHNCHRKNNNGVLLFSDSGRGFQYKNNYLQYMADNYFSPEYKNLEFVKMYYFSTSNKKLVELSQQCTSMFSADTAHLFIPQKAGYASNRITDKISPADECSMEPDRGRISEFYREIPAGQVI